MIHLLTSSLTLWPTSYFWKGFCCMPQAPIAHWGPLQSSPASRLEAFQCDVDQATRADTFTAGWGDSPTQFLMMHPIFLWSRKTQVALTASIFCWLDELVVVKNNIFLGKPKLPYPFVMMFVWRLKKRTVQKLLKRPSGHRAIGPCLRKLHQKLCFSRSCQLKSRVFDSKVQSIYIKWSSKSHQISMVSWKKHQKS